MNKIIGLLVAIAIVSVPLAARAETDTLRKIKTTSVITIAYPENALPYAYKDEKGEPEGYSIAICKRVVASLAQQLGLAGVEIRWKTGNTPERLEMVAKGEADMDCGTTSITLSRQEKVDFSNEIFVESGGILVLSASEINTVDDLAGKKIAVIPGTTTEKRLSRELKKRLISAQVVEISSAKEGIQALTKGKADAYAGDRLVLFVQVTDSADPSKFAMLGEQFSIDPYGLVLPRGDTEFRLAVNRALAQLYRSEAIGRIFTKAFGPKAEATPLLKAVYLLNAYQD
jgi:glutamate/aspartate transport system substrate-binding protein